ncbi:uncharacterized protein N7459_008047 [Penicillium hispanicum]|uniref:uncharacterized protein n=1 Tax=Penicillium hispanicum TaxID=1080232 RepID=UPI0025412C42|nr:uncharacterized protein N7459_008047 [Penicillium hispanicum]KAJ5573620.1 hypothetical protein N7459_008047 [Penicillium hispanicum]
MTRASTRVSPAPTSASDYGVRFITLSAGTKSPADLNAHADKIGTVVLGALIKASMKQAAKNFNGAYAASNKNINSSITIELVTLPGLFIENFDSNGTNFRETLAQLTNVQKQKDLSIRLYPTPLVDDEFRLQDKTEFADAGTPTCVSGLDLDKFRYAGRGLDVFIFTLDKEDKAVSVKIPALQKTQPFQNFQSHRNMGLMRRQMGRLYQSTDGLNRRALRSNSELPDTDTDSLASGSQSGSASADHVSQDVDEQVRDLFRSTHRVFIEVHDAKDLRDAKAPRLGEIERKWINSTISDADEAARELATLLEPHRVDQVKKKGKISSANRKRWKNVDGERAWEKRSRLLLCQSRLNTVFSHLQGLDLPVNGSASPDTPELMSEPFIAELPSRPIDIKPGSTPAIAELPCGTSITQTKSVPTISELPCHSMIIDPVTMKPTPRIVVTEYAEARSPVPTKSPELAPPSYESSEMDEMDEMDEMLAWRSSKKSGQWSKS